MTDFTRKKPLDLNILRKQILREAKQYTDNAIENAMDDLSITTRVSDEVQISPAPSINDLIPDYPIPEPKPPGVIESIKFLNDNNEFTYVESYSYGTLYVSSDGQYAVDVSAKAFSSDPEVSNIEVQITRIDDAG